MAKDFSNVNTSRVYAAIDEATTEGRYTDQEARDFIEEGRTQGRKGLRMPRVNMAFTPEVYEYIRTMSRIRGESITKFTNFVFEQHMKANAALYEEAKAFKERF